MIDYHIHPDYSIDAEPFSMADYCRKAVDLGLREICFTTHCEFDPLRKHLDWFVRCRGEVVPMHPAGWLDTYFAEIEECSASFAGQGLAVKAGLETGYDLGLERDIENVLCQYPFDFVIGSVHCLDHVAISSNRESGAYFAGKEPGEVARTYFTTLLEAVQTGLFDVIGHLDIYRRHGAKFLGPDISAVHREYIADILDQMAKSGTGLEINTSSLRHGQGPFCPGQEILSEAARKGVRYFTVGSDCHRIGELGQGVSEAVNLAKKCGLSISVYEKRKARVFTETGPYVK